jgi:hypothetical protein
MDENTIAFFYLLTVDKCTHRHPNQRRHTAEFCLTDSWLWQGTNVYVSHLPDNQKNGKSGSAIHHQANSTFLTPLQAIIRVVLKIC